MFNFGANPKVAGSALIVLNIVRVLTIIGLLMAGASAWIRIIFSGLHGKFDIFDAINQFFIFGFAVFLGLSEIGLRFVENFYRKHFPVLTPTHSLAWLALGQLVIGCSLLGDRLKPAYSEKVMGKSFWQLVFAAGLLNIIFSVFNFLASVIYRNGNEGVTARNYRTDGVGANNIENSKWGYDMGGMTYASSRASTKVEEPKKGFFSFLSKKKNAEQAPLPKRAPSSSRSQPDVEIGDYEPATYETAATYDPRSSPIAPHITRPDSILHPAYTGRSRYSEANMSRF